tara:strand:- start:119 stop:391 length:273 start_codon:yes stop_codon:yes gene_type:complete
MVDILKRRQLEIDLIAKEIFNDQRYSISYSAGKAIARYQLLDNDCNWRNDFSEKVFDTKAKATKFLKQENLDHADRIFESVEIEDEAYEY